MQQQSACLPQLIKQKLFWMLSCLAIGVLLSGCVPINTVKRLLPDLLSLGHYRHPWLGIRYAYGLTDRLAEIVKLPVAKGLLLVQLETIGPLAQAGIQGAQRETMIGNQRVYVGGDILLSVDDNAISTVDGLETWLEDHHQVGDSVKVTYLRQLPKPKGVGLVTTGRPSVEGVTIGVLTERPPAADIPPLTRCFRAILRAPFRSAFS